MQGANFSNVSFDESLLCRADLNHSTLQASSFDGAYLRGTFMDLSDVQVDQLKAAATLCGTLLPLSIGQSSELVKLVRDDPNGLQPCRLWVK